MKKLSADQLKMKATLDSQLQHAMDSLEQAVNDAESFRQEVWEQMDEYCSEKCEKWEEGKAGQAFLAWQDEWDSLEVVSDDPESIDLFLKLPTSVEG